METTILINASLSDVFEAFSDLDLLAKRVEGIETIKVLNPPAQMEVGTKWREMRIMFGKEAVEEMEVTELNVNKNYVIEADSHGTHYRTEYTFSETEEGVQVAMVFEGIPYTVIAKMMGVLTHVFAKSLKKLLNKDLNDLKTYLESENT